MNKPYYTYDIASGGDLSEKCPQYKSIKIELSACDIYCVELTKEEVIILNLLDLIEIKDCYVDYIFILFKNSGKRTIELFNQLRTTVAN